MNNTLHLTIKKQWFDMILSGEKTEEYRDIKPYYNLRFWKRVRHCRL
ncbi:ASCH domain-containing protein [Capnocytophaga sp. oral taxon 329]|nr:ASCH domain-containing protein [Capnocytophaga sp. oral taxon 329]